MDVTQWIPFRKNKASQSRPPHRVSGALPGIGHMLEFGRNPFELLTRAQREGGELAEIQLLAQPTVLVSGPTAHEAFFRAPDDQLCRREAYQLMTPIFGEGVVFDAPGSKLDEQLSLVMQSLREDAMRRYPEQVVQETERMLAQFGDAGEIDLLAFCKELFLYTAARCLMGEDVRNDVDARFTELYHDLERAIQPLAYFYPYLPIPAFRRRDSARLELVSRVQKIIERRQALKEPPNDGLQRLLDGAYSDGRKLSVHEITGIFIALVFAGHHTSSGTQTWVIIELLRNPDVFRQMQREVDERCESSASSFDLRSLRDHALARNVIREVLRLHPPLIFLFRKVMRDWEHNGTVVEAGKMLCASPAVSHLLSETYPNPGYFDPSRFERGEADNPFAYIAFGGGKHKCPGNAFGLMQIQIVTQVLLREFELELIDAPESYVHNYKTATVMPQGPVRVRYRRRIRGQVAPAVAVRETEVTAAVNEIGTTVRVRIDSQLCQGHAVCVAESPRVFRLGATGEGEVILDVVRADAGLEDALYAEVRRAAADCPNHAITLEKLSCNPN